MTCIIAYRTKEGCYLGSDTLACISGTKKDNLKTNKIFKISKNTMIGITGHMRLSNLVKNMLCLKELEDDITENKLVKIFIPELIKTLKNNNYYDEEESTTDLDGQIIIVNKNKIWEIDSFFGVIEWDSDYVSIGSGLQYAYGSLHTTKDMAMISVEEKIKIAIEAAAKYDTYVGTPIRIINNFEKENHDEQKYSVL